MNTGNLKLRTYILILIMGIILLFASLLTLVISLNLFDQDRDNSFRSVSTSLNVVANELNNSQTRLLRDSNQIRKEETFSPANIWFIHDMKGKRTLSMRFKRPYQNIASELYRTLLKSDLATALLQDREGKVLAFCQRQHGSEVLLGYIHGYPTPSFNILRLEYGQPLSSEDWERTQRFEKAGAKLEFDFSGTDGIQVISYKEELALMISLPVMGSIYDDDTEDYHAEPLATLRTVRPLDLEFMRGIASLIEGHVNLFEGPELRSGTLPTYNRLLQSETNVELESLEHPQDGLLHSELGENKTELDFGPISFHEIELMEKGYYQGLLPISRNSAHVPVIAVLFSKEIGRANTVQMVKLLALVSLLGMFLLTPVVILFSKTITRPIGRLAESTRIIAQGKLDEHIEVSRIYEIGTLARSFVEMGHSLKNAYTGLEEKVAERTAELEKLSETVEQSPVSVVITDKNGTIEYVNPRFSKTTGYSAKEAIGQNPRILKSRGKSKSFYKDLWDTILSGRIWRGEFINRKKSGEEFWESASISPIKNDHGNITHFVAVKEDITVKKQMEEELIQSKRAADEANKAKSDFLANMSHEIRTPMNAVIGMSHLALKTELTPKQQDYLHKIQSSANSLLGIINDILDFSKIEAGKLDMESVEFNLDDVLDNLANLVTVKAQEKEDLEVLFATAREVPRFLVGDPLRLGQIMINLANNAVKFTESGEIVVTTELLEQNEAGLTIQFSVKDTGIGMTEKQISTLFQSFSQADTSTTRKFGGTGLGLSISKRLVEMMGGEIWVESEPGLGTTFSFTANFGLGTETVKKRLVPSSDLRGMKVLVVDDSATSRNILQDMLESFTFEITLAASAEEGLEEIERADTDQPYELVLMDWKMPGMDGLEASKHIKNHRTLSKIPAIILVTAYGREELMQRAEQIGLEGFLIKPIGPSVLFDTIMLAFGEQMPKASRAAERHKEIEDLKDIQGARVLLVEDNEINQQVALEILQGAGLKVSVANDGREGVDAAMQYPYDAILMDIQMPVIDGYTATREIRNWELGLRNENGKNSDLKSKIPDPKSEIQGVPIIAMTAHAMAGDDKKSIEAGMNDHVTKPIDPDQLFATLQKWIRPAAERAAVPKSLPASGGPPVHETPPEPDQALPAEDELPESLPGFDLAAGLSRLMGNKRLYRKLLLDFGTKYTETAREIREALDAKDFEQTHSLVHNLKGLAGNLEATDLQAAAATMEKLVKGQAAKMTSDKELYQKFTDLEKSLEQALDAVQSLGPTAEKKTIASNKDARVSVPPELIKRVAESIIAAAEMGDVTQIKSIAEELKSESDVMAPFCDELIRLAEDFDFDGIQKLADALDES